ncbi:MAG: UDP-4-amino-4,6-dideoxy-N-acetyl-beta-L-altrosamine transaminase [Lachnospiraceae bacterium]|nr:UDP-4-amino-4,6-dideoxy-N-acetyl-beta-L-altrosamine transaminase [Lachnospiraceae bacterium]
MGEIDMFIPYGRQSIDDDDINAVVEVLKSDYLTTGPKVTEFEKVVADYVGAQYAVAVSNGTAALHIACLAAGISEGDEVITSPITFAASANCALYCGATPVFADIKKDTYNIDPDDIERKITEKTKAIIPVHYTGQPCEMDAIHEIAKKHNLIVIEDGAQVISGEYKGKKVGALSDMTTFSFHPVKPATTGEGGMVLTNDKALYEKLKLYHTHGITRDDNLLENKSDPVNDGGWYYEQLELGYNYRITDIQCALGISQMKKLDKFAAHRRELAALYDELLAGVDNVVIPYQHPDCLSSYHLYMIQVPAERRKEIFEKLRENGVGVNVHYIPVYKLPYYQKHGYKDVCCPNAEEFYSRAITLPLFADMTTEQVEYVVKVLKDIL